MMLHARMGEGCLFERNPSPIRVRGHTIVPSPARGEGTRGKPRAFCRTKRRATLAKRSQASGSSPRKRGPMITAGGYGSRPLAALGRDDIAWSGRSTNLWLCEMAAGAISLFRVVIYNDFCNSNVLGRRGRMCHPDVPPCVIPCATIRRHPICHPRCVTIHRHNVFEFEAPMPTRRIHIRASNPPPGPRPR